MKTLFVICLLLILHLNAIITLYQKDTINAIIQYPQSSKLFSDLNSWITVDHTLYDPVTKNDLAVASKRALSFLNDMGVSNITKKSVALILSNLVEDFNERGVYNFDAIVLHASDIPLYVIAKDDFFQTLDYFKSSKTRSIQIDYKKVATLLNIQEIDPTEPLSGRALEMYIESWIAKVLIIIILLFVFAVLVSEYIFGVKKDN